jgi:DNA-binding transcriptional MerR regulator
MERGLLIGEVAARSGLSRKALRLYEARGILPAPRRTPSGYRVYPQDVLDVEMSRRLLNLRTESSDGSLVGLRIEVDQDTGPQRRGQGAANEEETRETAANARWE